MMSYVVVRLSERTVRAKQVGLFERDPLHADLGWEGGEVFLTAENTTETFQVAPTAAVLQAVQEGRLALVDEVAGEVEAADMLIDFERMSIDQLKEWAADYQVEVVSAKKKADYVNILTDWLARQGKG